MEFFTQSEKLGVVMSDNNNPNHERCMAFARNSCKYNSQVKFILKHLKGFGCEVNFDNKRLQCEPCEQNYLGGFDPQAKEVVLCENNLASQEQVDQILTHELIHAFDVCRVKYDKENIRHLACSEIRASSLSRECTFLKEWFRTMNFKVHKQFQNCVKHKAGKSVSLAKSITREQALVVVEEVFLSCFNDHAPFKDLPS